MCHWPYQEPRKEAHAYHEPGGDFSPQAPSFGVSLWLCDTDGHPVVNSKTVPLSDIQQRFAPSAHPHVPGHRDADAAL